MTINEKLLRFSEVDQAPTGPGLYAWYAVFSVSLPDLARAVDANGADQGEGRFRKVLARHLLRFQPSQIDLRARNTFGADWRGELEDYSREAIQARVLGSADKSADGAEPEASPPSTFDEVVGQQRLRQLLADVLSAATPRISAPIYIGVAKDIRSRLNQHTVRYKQLRDAIGTDEQKLRLLRQQVRRKGMSFADRAIVQDFQPEHLWVATLPIAPLAKTQCSEQELREVAGVAEWLLNRWHRPFAGMR
ncbi:hypothetical protein [Azospirillum sp. sgz302134]